MPLSLSRSLSLPPSLSLIHPYIRTAIALSLSRLLSLYRGIGGPKGCAGRAGWFFPSCDGGVESAVEYA